MRMFKALRGIVGRFALPRFALPSNRGKTVCDGSQSRGVCKYRGRL